MAHNPSALALAAYAKTDTIRRLGRRHSKDEPGQAEFHWHLLAVTPEVGFVQSETSYRTERHTCGNLWVIRLDSQGRCAEFVEWWMRHPAPGEPAAGPSGPP